jgi:PAS domain S-box-containing protein
LNTAEETEKASLRLTMETRKSIAAAEGMMLVVARESRRVNFIGMVLGIAAGLLVAFFMGRALNVSIRKLILGIKEVAKGDLSYRVRLGMSDEIGQLADAFNKMADDLGASRRREQEKAAALAEEVVRREHIEVLLRQNEAYLRTIFDSVRTGVMLVDQETHVIVDANPMVVKMFGKPKEQIVGALCHAYVCPAQQGKCPITDLGQTVDNAERIFVTSSGARVPVLKTVLPVTINDRKLLLESFADVTELKAAEKELQFAYDQLRDAQAQLLQTAKMASLGQMAGGVAHEINNPLTGVLNNVQLIKMLAQDRKEFNMKDFDDLLAAIEASAVRCKNITQSLLNFSHTSHGVFQDVSMNEVMEKVVALIEQELRLQNVTIRKELDPDLPLIKGDSQLLQQVVFDLISNGKWAVQKKAEGKGGEIILKTRHDRQNNVVMFSVGDTGIGISRENQEKIFEPFFTTKDVGEGTGLGLSLVFNIIKAHEGTIEIESEVGQGTTFKISLPVF